MSSATTLEIGSSSPEDTLRIAGILGHRLRGGEVIELVGDLGAGKTVFVRGLASGAGSTDVVQSPSFTISRIYKANNAVSIYHFDFHRLEEPGVVAEELAEATRNPKAVVVVEWSNVVQHVLPKERLGVTINTTKNENERKLVFAPVGKRYQQLVDGLK